MFSKNCLYIQFPYTNDGFFIAVNTAVDAIRDLTNEHFLPKMRLLMRSWMRSYTVLQIRCNTIKSAQTHIKARNQRRHPLNVSAYAHLNAIILGNLATVIRTQLLHELIMRKMSFKQPADCSPSDPIFISIPYQLTNLRAENTHYQMKLTVIESTYQWVVDIKIPPLFTIIDRLDEQSVDMASLPCARILDFTINDTIVHPYIRYLEDQEYSSSTTSTTIGTSYGYRSQTEYDSLLQDKGLHSDDSQTMHDSEVSTPQVSRNLILRFHYGLQSPRTILNLINDLHTIDAMTKMARQLHHLLPKLTEHGGESNFFKILLLSHLLIVIDFGRDRKENKNKKKHTYRMHITWDFNSKQYQLLFHPAFPASKFLSQLFNKNQDMMQLLRLVELVPTMFYALQENLSKPSHRWIMIPQSISQMILIYRKKEFSFSVSIGDEKTSIISNFDTLMALGLRDLPIVQMAPPSNIDSHSRKFESHFHTTDEKEILEAIDTLNHYVNSLFALDALKDVVHSQILSKGTLRRISGVNGYVFLRVNGIVYSIGIGSDYKLECNLSDHETTLSEQEREQIRLIFDQSVRICQTEDKTDSALRQQQALTAFITLVHLPIIELKRILKGLANINAHSKPQSDDTTTVELMLTWPQDLCLPKSILATLSQPNELVMLSRTGHSTVRATQDEITLLLRIKRGVTADHDPNHIDIPIAILSASNKILLQVWRELSRPDVDAQTGLSSEVQLDELHKEHDIDHLFGAILDRLVTMDIRIMSNL